MVRHLRASKRYILFALIVPLRVWAFKCDQPQRIASYELATVGVGLAEQSAEKITVILTELPPVSDNPQENPGSDLFYLCIDLPDVASPSCLYASYQGWTP